jgi:hypothetical protein
MPIVDCTKHPQSFRLVDSTGGEWFDGVDLEIMGAVAFAA